MTISQCMSVVERLSEQDQAALLGRIEKLQARGMSANKAAVQAAMDMMADLQDQAAPEGRADVLRSTDRGLIEDVRPMAADGDASHRAIASAIISRLEALTKTDQAGDSLAHSMAGNPAHEGLRVATIASLNQEDGDAAMASALYGATADIAKHLAKRFGKSDLNDVELALRQAGAMRDPHQLIDAVLSNSDVQNYLNGLRVSARRSQLDVFADGVRQALGIRARHQAAVTDVMRSTERQLAWHGTPHKGIEKTGFKLNNIGTGEGNQAFGWGTYFAGNKDVAEHYRKGLSYRDQVNQFRSFLPDDADIDETVQAAEDGSLPDPVSDVVMALAENDWLGFDYPAQAITAAFKELDAYDPSPELRAALQRYQGQLYRANIPADALLLDWDKPLSDQPRIMSAMAGAGVTGNMTGREAYAAVAATPRAASELLLSKGIPGLRYLDGASRAAKGEGTANFVIWDEAAMTPEAAGITAMLSRDRNELGFYSALSRGVDGMATKAAAAGAWKSQIKGLTNKGLVKQDEVDWVGLDDWLDMQPGKISKESILDFLLQGGVKVEESFGVDRYANYVLPGGENYREVLLTLPHDGAPKPAPAIRPRVIDRGHDESGRAPGHALLHPRRGWQPDRFDVVGTDGQILDTFSSWSDAQEEALTREEDENIRNHQAWQQAQPASYKSSHWDAKNVLAHIRVNDRTDTDGRRVLFVEEVQSDWGQDAKKKGVRTEFLVRRAPEISAKVMTGAEFAAERSMPAGAAGIWLQGRNDIRRDLGLDPLTMDDQFTIIFEDGVPAIVRDGAGDAERAAATHQAKRDKLEASARAQHQRDQLGRVPDAPFIGKTDGWLGLALKRIMTMAVDGGYDAVAFVSGQQSADRYDLSQQVESIGYEPKTGRLQAFDHDRNTVIDKTDISKDQLEDYIGKEVAQRLLASDPVMGKHLLSGEDIKGGGEGMITFYDKIVPSAVKAAVKKAGGTQASISMVADHNASLDAREAKDGEGDGSRVPVEQLSQPGFLITDAMREKLAGGVPLFSRERSLESFSKPRDIRLAAGYTLGDLLETSKKVSWWDKSVGSMYNLGRKHPEFKRVYDAIQNFIGGVSTYGNRAADMAPNMLPKLDSIKDVARSPLSVEDTEAVSRPTFQGTLFYTRDEDGNPIKTDDVGLAGVVWRDSELREMFGLNDRQIGLYRETRKAINKSLTDLALTDLVRYAGKDGAAVRDAVLEAKTAQHGAEIMAAEFERLAQDKPGRRESLEDSIRVMREKASTVHGLIAKGYAPLMRFGDYTVYVKGKDGEQIWFGMYETQREANRAKRAWSESHPDADVTTGTMSKESYKLFNGVTPETLSLFGESLGLEESGTDQQSQVFQAYLKAAKTNRSAMKRMIERKGVAGFSEDIGRVLAGFVYSNARQSSTNLYAGEITKSASEVGPGDLKDMAIKLVEYTQSPAEEAQALRGLLFINFIGGSVASALINLTQTAVTTWPTLSQHFGAADATKAIGAAMNAVRDGAKGDQDLADALKRADAAGITAPQEVHHLQGQAAGRASLAAGDGTKMGNLMAKAGNLKNKSLLVWGKLFGWAEQMNRRIAFAAAYKLARERGMADPFAFAEDIVVQTQFTMNKGNNPVWSRGAVGATIFTFKKFGFLYLESLARMWGSGPEGKKAFALALGVMFLLAGTGGFPFADDLDDLIDGFAQRVLNKSFSSKQAKKEFFAKVFGKEFAEFVEAGLSGLPGAPIDVSGRLGMGNVIPGTGVFTKKQDYSRDAMEIGGAGATFISNWLKAAGMMAQGNVGGALQTAAPMAAGNVAQAVRMADMGFYSDTRGRRVIDTTLSEAILKGIGFQPSSVKQVQEATFIQQSLITQNKMRAQEISDKWAKGRIDRKPELVDDARAELAEWNRANPHSPIEINMSAINKRVQEAMMEKAQRITKTAPRAIRQAVKEELAGN